MQKKQKTSLISGKEFQASHADSFVFPKNKDVLSQHEMWAKNVPKVSTQSIKSDTAGTVVHE